MFRVLAGCLSLVPGLALLAAPPAGFVVERLGGSFNGVVGTEFLPDGALLAWEYGGKVWRIEANGTRQATPVIDISDEVGRWGDHGLLGLALHPNFAQNGFVFLLYSVDREHLLRAGTPEYNPATSIPEQASISRLTRYRIQAQGGWRAVDASSRTVLLGSSVSDGFPLVNRCHGEGSLVFGEDGTLLVSFGDSASPWYVDYGLAGPTHDGYTSQALTDGSLRPKSHVGAFRSQLVDDLSGKILRIDPDTGAGLPSNPFFDPTAPQAPRSKVWALGLRNPYRITRLPETGSHDPAEGDPGTLVVGDVGWDDREEIDLVTHGGMNFGWPLYEGITPMTYIANNPTSAIFHGLRTANPDAGLAPGGSCGVAFVDLLAPSGSSHWVNGCALAQLEDGTLSPGLFARSHGGFSGRGYVDFIAASGESAQANVSVPASGATTLSIRYALGDPSSRQMRLAVDGQAPVDIRFDSTGRWDLWGWLAIPVTLAPGTHTVRVESSGESGPNIDGVVAHTGANPGILGPAASPRFLHSPPILDMPQPPTASMPPRVPASSGPLPWRTVDDPSSPRISDPFTSECIIAGPKVCAEDWPSEWRNRVFVGDYTARWIRALAISPDGSVTEVKPFDTSAGIVMWMGTSPLDGQLYVARFTELVRIRYQPSGNRAPVPRVTTSTPHGIAPLRIDFNASTSADPEGGALSFSWDFGDGSTANGVAVSHVFDAPGGMPRRIDVRLTVRDAEGAEASLLVPVWPGNRPPDISLDSPIDGALYDAWNPSPVHVEPQVSDPDGQPVSCAWELVLHHDAHTHPWGGPSTCSAQIDLKPTPCGGGTYAYSLVLTATDSLGLSSVVERNLLPRCTPCPEDIDSTGIVDIGDVSLALVDLGAGAESFADIDHSGAVDFSDINLILIALGPCP